VRIFTSHLKAGAAPVLVREGFSWGAALFGWVWLLWQRAWIPAALAFAVLLLVSRGDGGWGGDLLVGLVLLQGCFGRDLVRWSLGLRGYVEGPVVAARDADGALTRLVAERGDLVGDLVRISR
jgi:hypothetical protein